MAAAVGILVIAGVGFFGRDRKPRYEFVLAERKDVTEEVSVSGQVRPAAEVSLAFERAGKVGRLSVKVGDTVKAGQVLVTLSNADLAAQVLEAQANLEAEQARLLELEMGARPEEIQAAETKVANAQASVDIALIDYSNTVVKADAEAQSAYTAALTAAQKAVVTGKNALLTLTDIQFAHFTGSSQDEINIANAKAVAVESLLAGTDAAMWTTTRISQATGGAYGEAQSLTGDSDPAGIDLSLTHTLKALNDVKFALGTIPVSATLTATEKANLAAEKTNIANEIIAVSGKQQAVFTQKSLNLGAASTAKAEITRARNALRSAQDELALKRAGNTAQAIAAQAARVKSLEANLQNARATLRKTVITAPFNGLVTRQEAKVGEIVMANAALVSVIADAAFEIEAFIPEADIAKVKIGDEARVTLDAYSSDVVFEAAVRRIDPAETIIEGVATYKTILEFIFTDPRIRAGLTANLDILTQKREQVLAIPERALQSSTGKTTVKVLGATIEAEREVATGLRGSDGSIEIRNGLAEGEKVIVSEPSK